MKTYIFIFTFFFLASCASTHPTTQSSPLLKANRGRINLTDDTNRIVASVDTPSGTVDYFQPPERAFEVAFKLLMNVAAQQEVAAKEAELKAKPAKKPVAKKKEKAG